MSTIFLQYFDNKLVKIKTCVEDAIIEGTMLNPNPQVSTGQTTYPDRWPKNILVDMFPLQIAGSKMFL